MNKVIVIGTVHMDGGSCTSSALLEIIRNISPAVIFCEAPPEIFPAMLRATENFSTPEIDALRMIIEENAIEIIPVDLHNDPFDGGLEEMHNLFRSRIRDYFCASEIQAGGALRSGFPFLNSEDSDQISKDKVKMELIFVAKANHYQLSKLYSDWLIWNDERENHWINRIHEYYKNKSGTAIFLVGAAHRVRLQEKIKNFKTGDRLIETWDFYPFK